MSGTGCERASNKESRCRFSYTRVEFRESAPEVALYLIKSSPTLSGPLS